MERRSFLKGVVAVIGGIGAGSLLSPSQARSEVETIEFASKKEPLGQLYGCVLGGNYYADKDGFVRRHNDK
jgi:hypothetical protein